MHIKLEGSFANGFGITDVIRDPYEGSRIAISQNTLIEYIEVSKPCLGNDEKRISQDYDEAGDHFIMFGSGLDVSFHGPFSDADAAEAWAEDERSDSEEWSLFVYEAPKMAIRPGF